MKVICRNILTAQDYRLIFLYDDNHSSSRGDDPTYLGINEYYCHTSQGGEWAEVVSDAGGAFDLKENQELEVHGIMFFEGEVRFLVINSINSIGCFPQHIFDIIDNRLPITWRYGSFSSDGAKGNLLSYKRLAEDYDHLIGLLNGNEDDRKIFENETSIYDYL